jgi:hypothetical protein
MCTVTFVPTPGGFVFTTNRDEDPVRSANRLVESTLHGQTVYYPQDKTAKGSWIAFSDNNRFVCVLNGAFEPHQRQKSYRLSRGQMALASFDFPSIDAFLDHYAFEGIEAFTLLLYKAGDFREVKWDEKELHVRTLDITSVHLWSSCTLYNKQWWLDRSIGFNEFVSRKQPDQKQIMTYHKKELLFVHSALEARMEASIPLDAIALKTTSISSIKGSQEGFTFHFQRTDGTSTLSASTF